MKGKLAFLDRWYEGTKALARHPKADYWLSFVSFIESSVFPIPPDLMLIPMVQANLKRWWVLALNATIFSVLGGIAGYFLGMFFFESLAMPVLDSLGKAEKARGFMVKIQEFGGMAVFGAGLTPFPYKVITITSGAAGVNFGVFIAASVIARSLRFFLVAGIVRLFGPKAEQIMKDHFAWFTVAVFAAVLVLWVVYKYVLGH